MKTVAVILPTNTWKVSLQACIYKYPSTADETWNWSKPVKTTGPVHWVLFIVVLCTILYAPPPATAAQEVVIMHMSA